MLQRNFLSARNRHYGGIMVLLGLLMKRRLSHRRLSVMGLLLRVSLLRSRRQYSLMMSHRVLIMLAFDLLTSLMHVVAGMKI